LNRNFDKAISNWVELEVGHVRSHGSGTDNEGLAILKKTEMKNKQETIFVAACKKTKLTEHITK